MTAIWQPTWSRRTSLTWALVGPTLVLLIEIESALALLDGLGTLPGQLRGWQALIAGALLVMVLAAQLSTALWRRLGAVRRELSEHRQELEERESAEILKPAPSADAAQANMEQDKSDGASAPNPRRVRRVLRPTQSLAKLAKEMTRESADFKDARHILERFGLEPSWAFQQFDDNLGVPAAHRLTYKAQLVAARWAGHVTALAFAMVAFVSSYAWALATGVSSSPYPSRVGIAAANNGREMLLSALVLVTLLLLLLGGQYLATGSAGQAVILNEGQFYTQVENLLELHRFELYRALAVSSPRDSTEEKKGQISAWRLGSGGVSFDQGEASDNGDVQQQVAGLAELLRGPELITYDGFVSWEARDEQIELAFAHTPILDGGYARLEVNGSRTASHALFDITADSDGVALVKVRASVNAPVGEGAGRITFDFRRPPDAGQEPPELWFEISQRGRFIQLLRVKAPRPSSQKEAQ